VLISHNVSVVRHMSDRVAVMYLGQIVELGSAAQVLGEPRHPIPVCCSIRFPAPVNRWMKRWRYAKRSFPATVTCPKAVFSATVARWPRRGVNVPAATALTRGP
jgi:peptide/nickel transport system ATP-binding protein